MHGWRIIAASLPAGIALPQTSNKQWEKVLWIDGGSLLDMLMEKSIWDDDEYKPSDVNPVLIMANLQFRSICCPTKYVNWKFLNHMIKIGSTKVSMPSHICGHVFEYY